MSNTADDRPEAAAPEPNPPEAGAGPAVEAPASSVFAAPTPVRRPTKAPSDAPVWLAAAFVSGLWAFAPIAFALGYRQGRAPFDYDPFVLLILGAMAVGPAGLVWIAASLLVEGRRLRRESQRAGGV